MYEFAIVVLLGIGIFKVVDMLNEYVDLTKVQSILTMALAAVVSWALGFSIFEHWNVAVRSEALGYVGTGLIMAAALTLQGETLTVGDGLVSQIPALLISIASGLIVTRAATENDMGTDMLKQFGKQHRAIRVAGACVAFLAIVPGIPKIPFLVVGGGLYLLAGRVKDQLAEELGKKG